ncbi:MAG: acyltransferase [Lachnospiraceae bacterium]|nr:acyltransferase [Lachnospiraceae bacterium]
MQRKLSNVISIVWSFFRLCIYKLFHISGLFFYPIERISPNVAIEIGNGGVLKLGRKVRIHSGGKIRVTRNAICTFGDNVKVNYGCMFFCLQEISIGEGTEFGPNVLVYDHDHDFRCEGGLKKEKFRYSPVKIGQNCWIGANTVILRGSVIGDNSVIAAGSVVTGNVPADSILVQKRENTLLPVKRAD